MLSVDSRDVLISGNNAYWNIKEETNLYKVGIYLRLSRDDGEEKVSESIKNQRDYLTKHVSKQPNWLLVDIYIDDRIYRN